MGLPWQIIQGDVRLVCKTLEEKSFDATFSDPPYGLRFMGRKWDYDVPSVNLWAEMLRVLKPGAPAMMFGGSRTFHRLACSVEDAGFELTDTCMFLHAKGFPKSHRIDKALDERLGKSAERKVVGTSRGTSSVNGGSYHGVGTKQKAIDVQVTAPASDEAKRWKGYGTALKPAFEPIIVARRMLEGTYAENVLAYGVGGIDIDGSRIGVSGGTTGHASNGSGMFGVGGSKVEQIDAGRWPANVMFDEGAAALLDEMSGNRPGMKGGGKHRNGYAGGMFGASRFFFTSKASTFEREAGIEGEGTVVGSLAGGGEGANDPVSQRFTKVARNTHTTVKAIDLIRYFAKMILPPKGDKPRRILVPFSGSGSEMIGCLQAGWDEVVGIERESEYIAIAKQRIAKGGVFSQLQDRHMRRAEPSRAEPSRAEVDASTEGSRVTRRERYGRRIGPTGLKR